MGKAIVQLHPVTQVQTVSNIVQLLAAIAADEVTSWARLTGLV